MTANILVTGGAGFIGSHTCKALAQHDFRPIVDDNFTKGHSEAVRWGPIEVGDLRDEARLAAVLEKYAPVGVLHFAGSIEAGASIAAPRAFYENNVGGALTLLRQLEAHRVDKLVFSSTAAVYGQPDTAPVPETAPVAPINPYGRSKAIVENMLADLAGAGTLRYCALRYFNAAGADPEGELGEWHNPETHLIPRALMAALGLGPPLTLYGTDCPTRDGTCICDYVHVSDLAEAHVLTLRYLVQGGENLVANLGLGTGFTVREVLSTVREVTGRTVPVNIASRRPGDPAALIANPEYARCQLEWRPRYTDIASSVAHAARAPVRSASSGAHVERTPA